MVIIRKYTYRISVSELPGSDGGPLEVNQDATLDLHQLLSLLDDVDEHLVLPVLNRAHVNAENVRALLNQLAYRLLNRKFLQHTPYQVASVFA